ncbi:origin recognition complex subunit 1 [Halictus rubicundus]|uniref:origin recognition complex subunit 1 n=1 Tax=Halictus rubicundus TaxID=77578 RepID=UPI004035CC33
MTTKLNKYSDNQILASLDAQSDSDSRHATKQAANKLDKKRSSRLQAKEKNNGNVSSDEENIFESVRYALQKKRILRDEKVSLKIKLRRSTEQSLYKIDTDSECGRSNRGSKQSRRSCLNIESESSYTDSKSDSGFIKGKIPRELKNLESGQETLIHDRIRKPPLRLSSYYCGSLDSLNNLETPRVNSPSLRSRKNINYNQGTVLNVIENNMEVENKRLKETMSKNSNVSNVRSSSESRTPKNSRINKRNRLPSVNDNETDSSTDTTIIRTKSMRKSNELKNVANDKTNNFATRKVATKEEKLPDTPSRTSKQRSTIAEDTRKNGQHVGKTKSNEELADLYKCIQISSEVTLIPIRGDKQKRVNSENKQKSVQSVDNNKSDEEEESLANMYKRIKISSAKKKVSTPQKKNSVRRNIEAQLDKVLPSTPKSRSLKPNNLTPSIGKRHSALLKPATPLQEARSRLHVSAVPKSLPCREEEFNNIFTFLKGKLEDKSGGCIYISGVPGTGKTATVNEAVRCLQKLTIKGQLDNFDYVAINGMKLTEPRQSYVQILKQLDGRTVTWEQAYRILEQRFHRASSKMTLLLVDELDFLCTKRQDVVYNLLDWPTKTTAQLIVVTIANTMDLPERVLMGRVTSRLGLTRLTFQPYNHKQLQEIVMSRLKDFNGFRSEAVQLVARKVSAVSGDARRALDICRRAMEIAESRKAETISLQDVAVAVSEMIASAKVQAIKRCSKMEQVFLQAISAEVTRTSIEEVYFKDAYAQFEALCSFDGIKIPTVTEMLAICGRLGASRLLICEHSRNDIYQKILLNVSTDDIHYAIQELDSKLK